MPTPLNLGNLGGVIPKLSVPSPPANVGEPQTSSTGSGGGGLGELMGLAGAVGTGGLGAIPSITGGASGPSQAQGGAVNNRSPIHIAPVGVNLGAIISPYNEGSAENGGAGLDIASRFIDAQFGRTVTQTSTPVATKEFPWVMVIGCGAGICAILTFMKVRGR